MKKLFFRRDNTIRMETVYSLLAIIFTIFIIIIYLLSRLGRGITYRGDETTTTATTTTTMVLCKDCSFSFKEKDIRIKPDNTYLLKDLIDFNNITLKTIKFTVDDQSILKIETDKKGEVVLKTLNKVGHVKITAKYNDMEDSMNVSVAQAEYNSAIFGSNTYYVYEGETSPLNLITNPEGAPASTFIIESSNPNIVSFDQKNNIVGKSLGEAIIKLKYKNTESNAVVYVINNRLNIKVKENESFNYYDEYKYVSSYDGFIYLSVTLEDKNNMAYNNTNIQASVENYGKMNMNIEYVEKNIYEANSYLYKVSINTVENDSKDNYGYVIFTLSDGSKSRIKISR